MCVCVLARMVATLSKIGEGAFADVYGCQGDDWRKLALKVRDFDFELKLMAVSLSSDPPSRWRLQV